MPASFRFLSLFVVCLFAALPAAFGQEASPQTEKRLLLFTHFIGTTINSYTPENAASIPAKVLPFAVGSGKTALREFLQKQAIYIIREGIKSSYLPTASSFSAIVHDGATPTYTTLIRGKRTATLIFEGKEMQTDDLLEVEMDVAPYKQTKENPFGLVLTAYRENVLE